jgi:hypothetical protein
LVNFWATASKDLSGPMLRYAENAAKAFALSFGCCSNSCAIITPHDQHTLTDTPTHTPSYKEGCVGVSCLTRTTDTHGPFARV